MSKPKTKILISGGGTGGHIFPAISIANALKSLNPDIEILFVGAEGRMEMEKVPKAGYTIEGIPVMGFPRKPSIKLIKFFIKLYQGMRKAKKIVKNFEPDIAVGVGGYASGPALKAASKQKIPYVLQEQNSYPGITNKLLAKKAEKIFVAYKGLEKYFPAEKIKITGNPIRQDILNLDNNKGNNISYFGLKENKPCILVTGGSLGALTINTAIYESLEKFIYSDYTLIWQTGKNFIDKAKEKVKSLKSDNIFVSDFIFNMEKAYGAADIIISRAGAGTISELAVVGKPIILIPSPNVSEDHQTKNALALADNNAAIIVKDSEANDKLYDEIERLLKDEEHIKDLKENIKAFKKTDAANNIAQNILSIIDDK